MFIWSVLQLLRSVRSKQERRLVTHISFRLFISLLLKSNVLCFLNIFSFSSFSSNSPRRLYQRLATRPHVWSSCLSRLPHIRAFSLSYNWFTFAGSLAKGESPNYDLTSEVQHYMPSEGVGKSNSSVDHRSLVRLHLRRTPYVSQHPVRLGNSLAFIVVRRQSPTRPTLQARRDTTFVRNIRYCICITDQLR